MNLVISKNFSSNNVLVANLADDCQVYLPKHLLDAVYSAKNQPELDEAAFNLVASCQTLEQFLALMDNNCSLKMKQVISWYKYERFSDKEVCAYSIYALNNHNLDQKLFFCEKTHKRVLATINLVI